MGLTYISDDEEDETAELLRELEKIKRERAEQREQEVGRQSVEQGPAFALLTRIVGARKSRIRARPTRA